MAATSFGFRADQKITEVLKAREFTLSAEVIPPRNGAEQSKVLAQVNGLIESGAQFLAVTKGAGGSLRGGSLPIAQVIKEQMSVPCIAHFTCRDLTPEEVENSLIDHHYFGIRNVLALRGDPPDGQADWVAKPGGYNFAYQLMNQIRDLNAGRYLIRAGGPVATTHEKTDFCIGAAVYPEHSDEAERIKFFEEKVKAGAEYGITDMLFNHEVYARFLDLCVKHGLSIPILPGTRVLKSKIQATRMMAKFKVKIPSNLFSQLPEIEEPGNPKGLELFLNLTENLRRAGAPGVHVFVVVDTEISKDGLRELARYKKDGRL